MTVSVDFFEAKRHMPDDFDFLGHLAAMQAPLAKLFRLEQPSTYINNWLSEFLTPEGISPSEAFEFLWPDSIPKRISNYRVTRYRHISRRAVLSIHSPPLGKVSVYMFPSINNKIETKEYPFGFPVTTCRWLAVTVPITSYIASHTSPIWATRVLTGMDDHTDGWKYDLEQWVNNTMIDGEKCKGRYRLKRYTKKYEEES